MSLRSRATVAATLARNLGRGALRTVTHQAFPITRGSLRVRDAEGPIDIVRDRYGVPHVFAGSEADAFFGQGFVHAQDRLFQMELMRRVAAGRLAEIVGTRALESDRFMRRVGLTVAAEGDLASATATGRACLEAYANGVNAGVRSLRELPPEFTLLEFVREPWTPLDSLVIGRLLMFGFAGNWDTELLRERLVQALGVERAAAVEPVHPREGATVTGRPTVPATERLLAAYRAAVEAGLPVGAASNAWAVTSAHTATGGPLLASDPHLQLRLPGVAHVSHLLGGSLNAVGADFPGVPGIAIGHNAHIAWGITAGMADVSDCFVETCDPADPRRYRTPEGWAVAEERVERILVRDAPAVDEHVLVTRHGPVLGPAISGEDRSIALRSTALEPGDIVSAFLAIGAATNIEELERAIEGWPGTTFNFVFADVNDRVGYRMAGHVPQREHGEGLLPQDGARSPGPAAPWPPSAMPRLVDPPSGVVVSANQAPGGDLELGEEWCEPRRAERIVALLASRERHHVASFQAIQVDRYSAHLARLRDLLLARGAVADPEGPLLQRWDGRLEAESAGAAVAACVYEELARALTVRVAGAQAATLLGAGLEGGNTASTYIYRMQGLLLQATERAAAPWYSDVEDRDRQLAGAAARAVDRLRRRLGTDPTAWRWGALLQYRPTHPLEGVPVVGPLWGRGPFPTGGDTNTVSQSTYSIHATHSGAAPVMIAPAYRQVIDLADFDRSTFILATGTSGIPGHPRYDDCIPDYLAGRQRPLLYSPAAIGAAAEARLTLVPEGGPA